MQNKDRFYKGAGEGWGGTECDIQLKQQQGFSISGCRKKGNTCQCLFLIPPSYKELKSRGVSRIFFCGGAWVIMVGIKGWGGLHRDN